MAEHIDGVLRRPAVWAVAVVAALAAAILVLVGIGSFGLWTPAETALASAALADPANASPPALGVRLFGPGEAAARLPGAVVALLTLAAVAWAGAGFGSRRAGLLAAVALAGFPLFVLQARQLTSDLASCLGMALALGGLRRWAHAGAAGWGAFAPVAGLLIATADAGVLAGALPLLMGAALAFALADPGGAGRPRSWRMIAAASAGLAAALVITLLVVRHKAGVPSAWASWLLGGVPRGVPSTASFEAALETLGFGLFPLAGVVMFALCAPMRPGRGDVDGLLLLATAALALALATVQVHLLGQMNRAVVLAPAALALGSWFDRRLTAAGDEPFDVIAPAGASPPGDTDARLGFVVAVSALLLARDLSLAPEALLSVHLPARIVWPPGIALSPWVLGVGITCAAGLLALLVGPVRTRPRWRTGAVVLVLGPPLLLAFVLAHHLVPAVARHLSSRAQLDRFAALAPAGATLALYRVGREEAGVFAPPPTLLLSGAADLIAQLRRTPDLFALIPRGELAALEAAAAQAGVPFAIADASSMRHLLLAGRLPAGVADDNPLRPFIWHAHPAAPGRTAATPAWADTAAVTSTWGDAVALVRAEFPAEAARGKRLSLTLVFRVLARPPAGYKIFVHLERPGQPLLTGDHAPVGGDFPTEHWRPDDVVRDVHVIDLPRVTTARGPHRLSVGFWPGGDGGQRWPITAGSNDGADRVSLGSVQIR